MIVEATGPGQKKKCVLPGRQIMREDTKKIEQRMDEKPMQLNSSEGPAPIHGKEKECPGSVEHQFPKVADLPAQRISGLRVFFAFSILLLPMHNDRFLTSHSVTAKARIKPGDSGSSRAGNFRFGAGKICHYFSFF